MNDIIIKAENLGKKYTLKHKETSYKSLREEIVRKSKQILGISNTQKSLNTIEEFWALENINFEIKRGERIGIIGRNGAGKSTLLKLMSRITEPTTGRITLRGRVSSLLEVGTGFHPELTGRENIYLNGAILGMTRLEVMKNFDEIVVFAGVEKFLDTPVKRYSSGMYMRLAFAVAAHLDPDILIIDEVLAVGDADFQKKCLGKMQEVSKDEGRTVLFVSHNINAIEQICTKIMTLEKGNLKEYSSDINGVIKSYLNTEQKQCIWENKLQEYKNEWFHPLSMKIVDDQEQLIHGAVQKDQDVWLEIEFIVEILDPALTMGYAIFDSMGTLIYISYTTDVNEENHVKFHKGKNKIKSKIPLSMLNNGTYRIELAGGLHFRKWLFEPHKSEVTVFLNIEGKLSDSPFWTTRREGVLAPVIKWEHS